MGREVQLWFEPDYQEKTEASAPISPRQSRQGDRWSRVFRAFLARRVTQPFLFPFDQTHLQGENDPDWVA